MATYLMSWQQSPWEYDSIKKYKRSSGIKPWNTQRQPWINKWLWGEDLVCLPFSPPFCSVKLKILRIEKHADWIQYVTYPDLLDQEDNSHPRFCSQLAHESHSMISTWGAHREQWASDESCSRVPSEESSLTISSRQSSMDVSKAGSTYSKSKVSSQGFLSHHASAEGDEWQGTNLPSEKNNSFLTQTSAQDTAHRTYSWDSFIAWLYLYQRKIWHHKIDHLHSPARKPRARVHLCKKECQVCLPQIIPGDIFLADVRLHPRPPLKSGSGDEWVYNMPVNYMLLSANPKRVLQANNRILAVN
jgi:hypothetical protein